MCPFIARATHGDALRKKRYGHIATSHDGQGQAERLSRPSDIVVAEPTPPVAWQCPLCKHGITRAMRLKISARIFSDECDKHRQDAHPRCNMNRWKKLLKRTPCEAPLKQQRRIRTLNQHAAKRKLKLIQKQGDHLTTFSWPTIAKRQGQPALCVHTGWSCKKCQGAFMSVQTACKHKCPVAASDRNKVRKQRLAGLAETERQCRAIDHGVDPGLLTQIFEGAKTIVGEKLTP